MLNNYSIKELNELANEIVRIAILDIRANFNEKEIVLQTADVIHNLPSFISHYTTSNSEDGWYSLQRYKDEIITGLVQLVKISDARNIGFKSNLELASFYSKWNKKGYFDEIRKFIKRPIRDFNSTL